MQKIFIILNVSLLAILAALYIAGMPGDLLADTAALVLLMPNLLALCIQRYRRDPSNANKKMWMGIFFIGFSAIRFGTEYGPIEQMSFSKFIDSVLLIAFGVYQVVGGVREKRKVKEHEG